MFRVSHLPLLATLALLACLIPATPSKAAGPVLLSPSDLDASIRALPLKSTEADALTLFGQRLQELKDSPAENAERTGLEQASQLLLIARRIRLQPAEQLPRLAGL